MEEMKNYYTDYEPYEYNSDYDYVILNNDVKYDNDYNNDLVQKFNKLLDLCDDNKNLIEIQNLLNTDDFYNKISDSGKTRILYITVKYAKDIDIIDSIIKIFNITRNDIIEYYITFIQNINFFEKFIDKYNLTIDEVYKKIYNFNDKQLNYLFFEKFKNELLIKYFNSNNNFVFRSKNEKPLEPPIKICNPIKILEDIPKPLNMLNVCSDLKMEDTPISMDKEAVKLNKYIKYINDELYTKLYIH
jgi:hypothetical protein